MRHLLLAVLIALPTTPLVAAEEPAPAEAWRELATQSSVVATVTVTTPRIRVVRPEKAGRRVVPAPDGRLVIVLPRMDEYLAGILVRIHVDELIKSDAHATEGGDLEVFFPSYADPSVQAGDRLLMFLTNPIPLDALGIEQFGTWSGLYGTTLQYPGDIDHESEAFRVASAYGPTLPEIFEGARAFVPYEDGTEAEIALAIAEAQVAADRTPPAVALTGPVAGALLRGKVSITGEATDDVALASAQVSVDGIPLASFTTSPFTAQWDTSALPSGAHTLKVKALDRAGNETETPPTAVTVAVNQPPTVSLTTSGTCGSGCTITFTSTAADPEDGALTRTWSGCASGSAAAVTCSRSTAGPVAATISVQDGLRQPASASASVPVYATAYAVGPGTACGGTAAFTCTSAAANGCSRPGTQTRSVTESSWSLAASAAVTPPVASQSCTETRQGYVASYYVGPWSGCSASCGDGTRARQVYANAWKVTPPSEYAPVSSESCNTSPCKLTRGDYGLYASVDSGVTLCSSVRVVRVAE
jgi:hypothetical protein